MKTAKVKKIRVNGFLILSNLYFHRKHTWVRRINEDTVRVGLDDFAQRLLGKTEGIGFICKEEVRQGKIGWEVKTRFGYAQLLSPIDGMVKRMNEELSKDSTLLNTDPYGKGWVLELEPFNIEESLRDLLKGDTAKDWLGGEVDRLHTRVEKELGVTIADGGELVQAVNERISSEEWRGFVKEFLLSRELVIELLQF